MQKNDEITNHYQNMSNAIFDALIYNLKQANATTQEIEQVEQIRKNDTKIHLLPTKETESYFIVHGYPEKRDWTIIKNKLLETHLEDRYNGNLTWLQQKNTTPFDVILAIWLTKKYNDLNPKDVDHKKHTLAENAKLKLVKTIIKTGPPTASYQNLETLQCTCTWSPQKSLTNLVENITYLGTPLIKSLEKMINNHEKKQKNAYHANMEKNI